MIPVKETSPGVFEMVPGGTHMSLDGERRATLEALLSEAASHEDRASFGIFMVQPAQAPADHAILSSRFERQGEDVVQVLETEPTGPSVPQSVTPRQLQLALLAAGRLDDIEGFLASPGVPRSARISWEYAVEYRRDDAMLNQMAGLLPNPMPPEEIDEIFRQAAAI